jgi:hypothetical protein
VVSPGECARELDVATPGKLPKEVIPAIDDYRSSFFGEFREAGMIDLNLLEPAVGQTVEKYEA